MGLREIFDECKAKTGTYDMLAFVALNSMEAFNELEVLAAYEIFLLERNGANFVDKVDRCRVESVASFIQARDIENVFDKSTEANAFIDKML